MPDGATLIRPTPFQQLPYRMAHASSTLSLRGFHRRRGGEMEKKSHRYPVADSPFWLHVETKVQRIGSVILFAVVIAGLLGLFSQGWLSARSAHSSNGKLTVQYDRYARLQSDIDMQLTAHASNERRTVFILGGNFMQDFEIRTLQPQPEKMTSQNGELVLEYARPHPDQPFTVWLGLTPQTPGSSELRLSLNDTTQLAVKQFIWP
ncbi:hypothetical protein [Kosakonia cowanii]|uniref:hypothetical protein n=1 Tax=Kosakonia cowanii TaxID=208223 RepID=UPI0025973D3D|nr:hypothetical protein [Kosakonia cowanii]MDT3411009.1 hypothetical protein [Atlantibacter sp. SORGH_AS_0304]